MIVRTRSSAVLGALTITAGIAAMAVPAHAAPTGTEAFAPVAFGASAWGSTVKVGAPLVRSDATAYVSMACTQRDNIAKSNDAAGADVDGLADIGAITTSVASDHVGAGAYTSTSHTTVAASSLLGGAIEIGAIDVVATASKEGSDYIATTELSLASLTVEGNEVELTGEGQVLNYPGLATIEIGISKTKELTRRSDAALTGVKVTLLDSGARVRIGEARAHLDGRAVNGTFAGGAYGTTVTVADDIAMGRTANQPLACAGTSGKERTNSTALVNLGQAGEAHTVESTVWAKQQPLPEAFATNTIESAELLGDLVQIDAIESVVSVVEAEDGTVSYDAQSSVGSVSVGGVAIDISAGGVIDLPGVGTLTLNTVTPVEDGRGAEVIAATVHIDATDTDVVLSRSKALIR